MVDLQGGKWFVALWCWTAVLAGCGNSFKRDVGLADLDSRNPAVRIMAVKWAGDNKVSAAVPRLVDFLEDEDPSVRFYAIEGLQRITGTDEGYDYKAGVQQRAAAVKRWREFVGQSESQDDESQH